MADLTNRLDVAGDETIGADGRAVVTIGPPRFTVSWRVTNLAVSVLPGTGASVTAYPTAKVYLGEESPGKLLEATYNGVQDSTDMDLTLYSQPGDKLLVVFEGGGQGDVAHVSVFGEEIIPQGR